MPAPIFSLATSGTDPKQTTKKALEDEVNRVVGITFDQANPEDRDAAALSAQNAAESEANTAANTVLSLTYKNQSQVAAIAAGAPLVTTLTDPVPANDTVEILQASAGGQVWQVVGGAWEIVGWLTKPEFPDISAMAAASGLIDGQRATVKDGANGQSEDFDWVAGSSLTADGALVVYGVGGQWVSKRTVYSTVAEMLADVRSGFPAETVFVAQGFRYEVAAFVATDHHLTTAGGVKLYEAGPQFTTLQRFKAAIARGVTYPSGASVLAAGDAYTYVNDGRSEIAGLTGWKLARTRTWYVSSKFDRYGVARPTAGSDSNTGLSATSPLAAIDAVMSKVRAGDTVMLQGGSYWREELDASAYDNLSIKVYGYGDRPILDGADTVANANFSLSGAANSYSASVAHALSGSGTSFSVWEDGVRLTRVASAAVCESTAGSFYAAVPGASPQSIVVHASDSSNVSSNGKTYEVSTRDACVVGAKTGTIVGIHTRRQGSNDGSLISYDYAEDCIAEDGTKHNMWNAGLAVRCFAYLGENLVSSGSSTLFVAYFADGTGRSARYVDCHAYGTGRTTGQVGFYSHTAGATKFDSVVYERCTASDCGLGFAGADYKKRILFECGVTRCGEFIQGTVGQVLAPQLSAAH
ncbi:hypothetical protein ACM25O_09080 [Sulfitobacter pontiacus]